MFTRIFNISIAVVLFLAGFAFAQNTKWSMAFMSSYFGDQAGNLYQVTAINKPISMGFQLQYFINSDLALKHSVETLNGEVKNDGSNELNVQSSLAIVGYPFEVWRFRPFLTQGILWIQQNNSLEGDSKGGFYYEFGLGTEFALSSRLFNSITTKLYSNGWNYHGWATSVSFGFRF